MAAYNNPDTTGAMGTIEGMDDAEMSSDKPQHEEEENAPTATLPKSILAGKKFNVGDEVVLKITGIFDDEVTVEYSYEGTKDEASKGKESEGRGNSDMSDMYE